MTSTAHDQHDQGDGGEPFFTLPEGATPGDAALVYLRAGLRPVILAGVDASGRCTCPKGAACPKPGKHPRRRMWQATPSAASLAADARAFPDGNAGLMMGGPERLIALDLDGPEGLASLDALERELGALPPTLTSETGGGGRHYIFRAPDWLDLASVKNTAGMLAPKVDLRAEGGQIVVAPSLHRSGRRYRWLDTRRPVELPEAWAERLATMGGEGEGSQGGVEDEPPPRASRPASSSKRSSGRARPSDDERRAMYARKALERTVDAISTLAPGTRNAALNAKAYSIGHFIGAGWLGRREVELALLGAALACGLDKSEAEATIRSGLDAGASEPWDGRLPEDPSPSSWSSSTRSSGPRPKGPGPAKASPRAEERAPEGEDRDDQGEEQNEAPASTPRGRSSGRPASWSARLLRDRKGLRSNLANVVVFLQHSPGWEGVLAFDRFKDRVVARRRPPSHEGIPGEAFPRPWRDADDLLVVQWLSREHDFDTSRTMVADAVIAAATANPFHPVRDYLEGLKHDGTKRVDTWLSTYLGVQDTPYARAVGAMWLRAAVARVKDPGCKVDTMLILEGLQDARKSTALGVLGGAWFTDEIAEVGSKDAAMQLRGAWVVELAELEQLGRADVSRIKAFLTRRTDRYRPAYGRHVVEQPRECIFAGTCNRNDYLRDETGGRRFWPVKVGAIDLAALMRDRDQLWAEAVAQHAAGERWWIDRRENPALAAHMAEEQEARFDADVWEDRLATWLIGKPWVTMGEVLALGIGVETAKQGYAEQRRAKQCLTRLGWEQRQVRADGGRVRRYFPKETPAAPPPPAGAPDEASPDEGVSQGGAGPSGDEPPAGASEARSSEAPKSTEAPPSSSAPSGAKASGQRFRVDPAEGEDRDDSDDQGDERVRHRL